ncbi:unnamed protein product [Ectocarpus sp. 12 AP-2014]
MDPPHHCEKRGGARFYFGAYSRRMTLPPKNVKILVLSCLMVTTANTCGYYREVLHQSYVQWKRRRRGYVFCRLAPGRPACEKQRQQQRPRGRRSWFATFWCCFHRAVRGRLCLCWVLPVEEDARAATPTHLLRGSAQAASLLIAGKSRLVCAFTVWLVAGIMPGSSIGKTRMWKQYQRVNKSLLGCAGSLEGRLYTLLVAG